jgi:hypothetical protein
MSNATPDTRGAGGAGGDRRRQRSRGGKGRNRNRQNQEGGGANRSQHQGDRQRGDRGERGERGPRPPRREYKPVPLTWWQKLLKVIGLYKEPVRPPRPEREERIRFEEGPPREVRSNTRNARQAQGSEPRATGGESRAAGSDAPQRRHQERTERPERSEVASARIYLGNLSYEASEEDLKDLFKGIGTVRNVEIVYNRRTHKSKGYGFVDMLNMDEAKRSVEVLHDQFFMGRKLVVSGAKTKDHEEGAKEEAAEASAEAASNAASRAAAAQAAAAAAATVAAQAASAAEPAPENIEAEPAAAPAEVAEVIAEPAAETSEAPAAAETGSQPVA